MKRCNTAARLTCRQNNTKSLLVTPVAVLVTIVFVAVIHNDTHLDGATIALRAPCAVVITAAAAAVKQSDVSTSRSRKNIHFNTSSVLCYRPTRLRCAIRRTRPPAAYTDRIAPRNEARLPSPSAASVANIEIIEFDGREISAATSCLLRTHDDNSVMELLSTTTGHNNCTHCSVGVR